MSRSYPKSGTKCVPGRKKLLKALSHAKERAEVRNALHHGRDPRSRKDLCSALDWLLEDTMTSLLWQGDEPLWRWVRHPEQIGNKFPRRFEWNVWGHRWDEDYKLPYKWIFGK